MKITVLRGDPRLASAAEELARRGYSVLSADPEERLDTSDLLLLPVPATRDGVHLLRAASEPPFPLAEVLARSPSRIFGGGFPADVMLAARRSGREVTDLLSIPAFVEENAVLTAEAALAVGMQASGLSYRALPVAVLGYGRIGAALTRRLVLLGARVTVFARREESRRRARTDGAAAYDPAALAAHLVGARLLFNTVPARLLTESSLTALGRCAIVELASGRDNIPAPPAGCGVTVTVAHGLPGRMLPRSAGCAIAHTLDQTIKKEGQ